MKYLSSVIEELLKYSVHINKLKVEKDKGKIMIKKTDNGKNNEIEVRSDKIPNATITTNGDNNTIIIE